MKQRLHPLSWLWLFPSLVLILVGCGIAFASHTVTPQGGALPSVSPDPYEKSEQGVTYHIAIGEQSGNVYINADGSSEYFVARATDYNPPIKQSDIDNSDTISFVARRDTIVLDPALEVNGTTITTAHKIVQLVFYDQSGVAMETYTTAEYTSYLAARNHPQPTSSTTFVNQWPLGFALIIAGLLWGGCTTLLLFLQQQSRKRRLLAGGVYLYGGGREQPYQPPYDASSPYDQLSNPYIIPPPPPYSAPQAPSEQFGSPVQQIEPTQFAPPPYPPYFEK